jgi:molybdenum cofactor cytidylyltransferase
MNTTSLSEKTVSIILSGGMSTRMNTHKALLRFSDSENFLQHIINVYKRAGVAKIIVVKNHHINIGREDQIYNGAEIVENHYPDKGRLYSIQLGLSKANGADYCFIQNIDNPFVTSALLKNLYNSRSRGEFITPQFQGEGGHPVLISAPIINEIMAPGNTGSTLREVLTHYNRYRLNTDDKSCLLNINYYTEYEDIFLKTSNTEA